VIAKKLTLLSCLLLKDKMYCNGDKALLMLHIAKSSRDGHLSFK